MALVNQPNKLQGPSAAKIQGAVNVIPVRLPRNDIPKKYSILKFNDSNNVDFTTCGQAKLERENNFKEFKSAYDIDTLPKFGAGSEFGREQKEEARKKKYGIKIKKYSPQEQPWLLKLGSGKQARKFKGIRRGGVLENASYYIFTQRSDGAFEASPVEEWYDFLPQAKYKPLSAEEAEEEYTKRGKTLNHFAIMVSKRMKGSENNDGEGEDGETSKKKKSSKKDKSLMLTEMDEWAESEDDNDDDDEGNMDEKEDEAEGKSKKKRKEKQKKEESDNEAVEEQDEFDEEKEIDYISGSSSDDEGMYDETGREDEEKYGQKGVVDEDGLRKLLDSDEEDEEEAKKDEENDEEEEGRNKEDQGSESDSSSDSDIDSDPEKEINFTSALFLPEKKPIKKQVDETDNGNSNRPVTPTPGDAQSNGKRKRPESQSPPSTAKKPKIEAATSSTTTSPSTAAAVTSSTSSSSQSDGSMEGLVKRYLSRKPITLKDLLQKITSKFPTMAKDNVMQIIGQILQRLKPEKLKGTNKYYVSIKKDSSS